MDTKFKAQTRDLQLWPSPSVGLLRQTFYQFNENPSRGKGDKEPTRNLRLKFVTFSCNLDLESA